MVPNAVLFEILNLSESLLSIPAIQFVGVPASNNIAASPAPFWSILIWLACAPLFVIVAKVPSNVKFALPVIKPAVPVAVIT